MAAYEAHPDRFAGFGGRRQSGLPKLKSIGAGKSDGGPGGSLGTYGGAAVSRRGAYDGGGVRLRPEALAVGTGGPTFLDFARWSRMTSHPGTSDSNSRFQSWTPA